MKLNKIGKFSRMIIVDLSESSFSKIIQTLRSAIERLTLIDFFKNE